MILKNYSASRAKKLSKILIPDILEPFEIKILWLQSEDFNHRSVAFNHRIHKHTFYELHFVLEGENIISDNNGRVYSIKSGEAVVLCPNSPHVTDEFAGSLKRFSIAFVLPENSVISEAFSTLNFNAFTLSEKTCAVLDDIFYEADKGTVLSPYIIRNKIFEIISGLAALAKYDDILLRTNLDGGDLRIAKAKKYIQDNSNLMLTCKDVANYCNFSEIYLNRIFKKHTGEALLKYIHRKKMEYGQELLRNKDLSLVAISELLGFSNEYYFNAFFKRVSGISPGAYRRQIQNDGEPEKIIEPEVKV